ncbi:MAG: hypothetical protein J5I93_30880 [Pirellulaceae bacterium]|nr:hypothetical protein [Pirellulaceae bacterium]
MSKQKSGTPETSRIPLRDVANQLREEIDNLRRESENQQLRFLVDEAEVELQVGLTFDGGGKIGFNCWLYSVEAGANIERATVQTIRLKLKPRASDSSPTPAADKGKSKPLASSGDVLIHDAGQRSK